MIRHLKRILMKFLPLTVLFGVGLSLIVQMKFATMGDKGWLLHAAGEWLNGKRISIDIFEVNPPLIIWLYAIPVWISRHCTFIEDYAALGFMGFCMALFSIRESLRIIARHPAFEGEDYRKAMFVLVLLVLFIFVTNPVYFADREFIMFTMTFPYVLRFCPSLMQEQYPRNRSIVIGVIAAMGFCIKPHAVVVFLLLQLYYFVFQRTRAVLFSTENKTIYACAALYFLLILITAPDYFTVVLPMALVTYGHFNVRASIHTYLPLAVSSLVIPFLDFRPRFSTPFRREVYYFLFITLFYGVYAFINNGWGYTYHPLFSMIFFLTCWLYWEYGWLKTEHLQQDLSTRPFEFGRRAAGFCMAINWIYSLLSVEMLLVTFNCGGYSSCDDNAPFDKYIAAHQVYSFGLMSGEFTRWPQISRETHAAWDTRFNHLWMMPALQNEGKGPRPDQRWIVDYVGNAYADDLNNRRPDIVFVDNSDEFFTSPYHIEIPKLLSSVPPFVEAWKHYAPAGSINRCASNKSDENQVYEAREGCRYDIYRRVDATKPPASGP